MPPGRILILLCGDHHDLVDKQWETYTAEMLRQWKCDHEQWVRDRLSSAIPEVGYAELEVVTQRLLGPPGQGALDFTAVPPREKMEKNCLSEGVAPLMHMGYQRYGDVEAYVEAVAGEDPEFPERLKAGFVGEYMKLWEAGLRGDELFYGLHRFACQESYDFRRLAAGLAVLVYLFHKCEVFER